MRISCRLSPLAALVASMAFPAAPCAADIDAAVEKAALWIGSGQNPDNGFGPYGEEKGLRLKNSSDVGITAFALYALARCPAPLEAKLGDKIPAAAAFLVSRQQPDGGFYDPRDPTLQNYKTCVALLALNALDRAKYAGAIKKAQEFIKNQQFDEDDGYKPDGNLAYGGFGYGGKDRPRPDLSNTQFGLEALAESGVSGSEELWKKAVVYIARCQNAPAVDPLLKELRIGTTGDGGFRYGPGESRGQDARDSDEPKLISSYGSMTYAGLKSLLYANVSKKDPMVQQAVAWISKNFTVRENPGMATRENPRAGLQGLYYYYHTMAKCLLLHGEEEITDDKGVKHNWARELSDHILSLVQSDGSWKNTSERWFEEIPVLATSFAVVALVDCKTALEKKPGAKG